MSKEIDLHLKKQLLDTPRYLKKYLKDNEEHSPGITYYTGNWGQDLQDNLTDRQAEKLRTQMGSTVYCQLISFNKIKRNILWQS